MPLLTESSDHLPKEPTLPLYVNESVPAYMENQPVNLAHIEELEHAARRLEPTREEWDELGAKVLKYAYGFVGDQPPGKPFSMGSYTGSELLEAPIQEEGIALDEALALLHKNVDELGINTGSGRFMAYIPSGGLPVSAFGDMLAAISNKYSGIFYSAPGAVRMENMLCRWMADIVGYPPAAGGFLASGGSLANLGAIVTARETHDIRCADIPRVVVYLSAYTHHCIDKALRLAGMKECLVRRIPVDHNHRMSADALEQTIVADKAKGLLPWLVVASAGTTDFGSVDPLRDIHQIARSHELWYHVDGAYGAFFVLCPEGAPILRGMESSDSLVLDPHKTMFIPYGTGAVLVKNKHLLGEAHGGRGAYLRDIVGHPTELSPAYVSPELTRPFRALRMWLPLKVLGLAPFRAALSEKICLARYFYDELSTYDGFEMGPYPDLSIVTYRYVPPHGDANTFNRALVRRIQADGRIFISSTRVGEAVVLRLAISCFRTHRDDIDMALQVLRELSTGLMAL